MYGSNLLEGDDPDQNLLELPASDNLDRVPFEGLSWRTLKIL